ncbi:MAG: DUF1822 family protein [Cyanomargarita calcarea GSE-NOS-MK-12-04C]|jgi:hypothetical protein|uniref:DUF1822 family protein n=1 Tax=Cyanomargarita calcarea GSE-NOS-MK-12-04C TaxID=2839659 RepID=A0A951USP6_9CYAN|nr:DUF1822 family protein [Cyanomargarita calcarea GSE-NOS-MK-12-04C]
MFKFPVKYTDLRLLIPEIIWLESEHLEQAKKMCNLNGETEHSWQKYLNSLALMGFKKWLDGRISYPIVNQDISAVETACHLQIGDFKFSLIAIEHLLDEVVTIHQDIINIPKFAAHFYVVLEVLEEEAEIIIRGFLRHDELVNARSRMNLPILQEDFYQIPFSIFDTEPNHLLYYCKFTEASAILSPANSGDLLEFLNKNTIKLSQWLQGAFDDGWQTIDTLINPEANLAFSTRNVMEAARRAKLIDLGVQLGSQTVALLVNIIEENEGKLGVLIQLHPTGGEKFLPPLLKLTLLSKSGKVLQEVQSRIQDNYIQLKPFKGEAGKSFSIKVTLGDTSIQESFEM